MFHYFTVRNITGGQTDAKTLTYGRYTTRYSRMEHVVTNQL